MQPGRFLSIPAGRTMRSLPGNRIYAEEFIVTEQRSDRIDLKVYFRFNAGAGAHWKSREGPGSVAISPILIDFSPDVGGKPRLCAAGFVRPFQTATREENRAGIIAFFSRLPGIIDGITSFSQYREGFLHFSALKTREQKVWNPLQSYSWIWFTVLSGMHCWGLLVEFFSIHFNIH